MTLPHVEKYYKMIFTNIHKSTLYLLSEEQHKRNFALDVTAVNMLSPMRGFKVHLNFGHGGLYQVKSILVGDPHLLPFIRYTYTEAGVVFYIFTYENDGYLYGYTINSQRDGPGKEIKTSSIENYYAIPKGFFLKQDEDDSWCIKG